MIDEELVARIQTEITDALGYNDEISKQRENAMEYYIQKEEYEECSKIKSLIEKL